VEVDAAPDPSGRRSPAPDPRRTELREPPRSAPKEAPRAAGAGAHDDLVREVAALRAAVAALQSSCSPKQHALGFLHAAGVEGELAVELASGAPRSKKGLTPGGWLRRRAAERLRVTPNLIGRSGRQLIACVGPTGAGKTTTLAKLAVRARLDLGRSVGVISLDAFRVGAVEQWQRYARLIGMPFHAAHDEASFEHALGALDSDIVLVDAEGRVPNGDSVTQSLLRMVGGVGDAETHVLLVVPAWLRGGDVDRLMRTYRSPHPTGVVVTKLDEASSTGGVLHACLPSDTPLAYTCSGPRVPEDIEDAEPSAILDRVFTEELAS
jgi:flagellar biosynthesis protein FlhF